MFRHRRSSTHSARELQSVEFLPAAPQVVITDLDGTLAVPGAYTDLARVAQDTVNPTVRMVLDALQLPIVVLSARPEPLREATMRWLTAVGLEPHLVLLAPQAAKDPVAVKLDLFDRYVRGRFNVVFALEDSAPMAAAWRSIGVSCFDVAGR